MDFIKWIKLVEKRLRGRYRIENIVFKDNGIYIEFEDHPSFLFYVGNDYLEDCSFEELCDEINHAFISQILNIEDDDF